MMFGQELNIHRIFKRLTKALIRLRVCAGWSEALLVAHTTLLEISCYVHLSDTETFRNSDFNPKQLFVNMGIPTTWCTFCQILIALEPHQSCFKIWYLGEIRFLGLSFHCIFINEVGCFTKKKMLKML